MKENKYHYDLQNVHYVPGTFNQDGTIMYGLPKRIYGAVSMDISPEGDTSKTRADGIDYIVTASNNGYSGTITIVHINDEFKRDCLGERIDEVNKIQYEDAKAEPSPFALLFEFVGDVKNKRHILYNNIASRIKLSGENKDNQKEPDMEELNITSSPALFLIGNEYKSIVKASTTLETTPLIYNDWYNRVHIPDVDSTLDTTLKTLSISTAALTPSFDKSVLGYTASTSNATNTITAEATDTNATLTIKVNGSTINSGTAATWKDGENAVSIRVDNGNAYTVYNIVVTKEVSV